MVHEPAAAALSAAWGPAPPQLLTCIPTRTDGKRSVKRCHRHQVAEEQRSPWGHTRQAPSTAVLLAHGAAMQCESWHPALRARACCVLQSRPDPTWPHWSSEEATCWPMWPRRSQAWRAQLCRVPGVAGAGGL